MSQQRHLDILLTRRRKGERPVVRVGDRDHELTGVIWSGSSPTVVMVDLADPSGRPIVKTAAEWTRMGAQFRGRSRDLGKSTASRSSRTRAGSASTSTPSAGSVGVTRRDQPTTGASPLADRLSIATFATGIGYADTGRERNGDYLQIAFLPFSTLELEWSPGRHPPEMRALIERHATDMARRRGQSFQVSSSDQTVVLGRQPGKRDLEREIDELADMHDLEA